MVIIATIRIVRMTANNASVGTGGVRVNVVPKDGGNTFSGGLFFSGTNENFQSNNIDQDLRDRGLEGTTEVKRLYDVAPTFGGPIKRDKLWFFVSARRSNNLNYAANLFRNATPEAFTYTPDTSERAVFGNPLPMAGVRLTWQVSPRNKIAGLVVGNGVAARMASVSTPLNSTVNSSLSPPRTGRK